jgi:hypothetical protein
MFRKIVFSFFGGLVLVGSLASAASAQTTGSQAFNVVVPRSLTITAPSASTSLDHNLTATPQAFPAQVWAVRGNLRTGVVVNFATASPFVHTADSNFKRNAKLDLAVGSSEGPANWTIDKSSDSTAFATGDSDAQVSVSSNGVGRAELNLTVSFLTDDLSTLAEGNYATTVVGTIAAK